MTGQPPTPPSALLLRNRPADGFRGIWYGNQPCEPPHYWKYSGAMATYPQQHLPIAVHRPEVRRTYFVYGASETLQPTGDNWTDGGEQPGETIGCVSYFDHATGRVARPVELLARELIDAHENPVLCIDPAGHLLVFCPAHGSRRPSCLLRSTRPHDIGEFQLVRTWAPEENFSYPQPWWVDGHGCVFLHTFYADDARRRLGIARSPDGVNWPAWEDRAYLSRMSEGSYQISWPGAGGRLATAFDCHPTTEGDMPLNRRRNLYFAVSVNGGRTWQTAGGEPLELPLTDEHNPALVRDTASEGLLLYLKDVLFDPAGRPVVLYLTSRSAWPGPEGGPFTWWTARFGKAGRWTHHPIDVAEGDHNYDHGSLLLPADDDWRLLAPVRPGPQRFATGGTMCLLQSRNRGRTWNLLRTVATDGERNHSYARRPLLAHQDFAWIWAAGNSHHPGETTMFFADADGNAFALPREMDGHDAACMPVDPCSA